MATRIRYVPTENLGEFVSKQHFVHPENGSRYLVKINERAFGSTGFKIVEDLTGKTVVEGVKVNSHKAKIEAKNHLAKLGIVFQEDVRNGKVKDAN